MDKTTPLSSASSSTPTSALPQLRDIHLPSSPDFWPPAPGWWFLATLCLFIASWLFLKFIAARKLKKKQQAILATLKPIEAKLLNTPDSKALSDLNIFIRQLALTHFPQTEIASLSGHSWLTFLDESGQTRQFTQGAGKILATAPYFPDHKTIDKPQAKALLKIVKDWIKKREITG